jgi:sugar-specific transcriptional regulator TrmB
MLKEADSCIQMLMKLGLTQVQATVYLTNAHLEKADVTRISKLSDIARSDVYRVIPALEKRGLIEKTIGTPIMYKAIPLKEGFLTLLKQKNEENCTLEIETDQLLQRIKENEIEVKPEFEESEFIITSEANLYSKHFETQIKAGEASLDFIVTTEAFKKLLSNDYENFLTLLTKGVTIRIVTEIKASEENSIRGKIKELKKNNLKLKYTKKDAPLCMVIIDNKAVNCQISDQLVPNLWSNNAQLLKIVRGYYEWLWNKAK